MYSYGSPHMAAQKQGDQLERTFSSYVRIQVVVLKTYLGRWTIGRSGERGSGISVLPARYDDDDDLVSVVLKFTTCWLLGSFFLSTNHGRRSVSLLTLTWLIGSWVLPCPSCTNREVWRETAPLFPLLILLTTIVVS